MAHHEHFVQHPHRYFVRLPMIVNISSVFTIFKISQYQKGGTYAPLSKQQLAAQIQRDSHLMPSHQATVELVPTV